ncbi:MAG: ATP-dependent helicase [Propionibacteriaceae bacterium]|nr:ATP-dependent helicase [Propionibacteriaceae bacterium]
MSVLHALWSPGEGLLLWGEDPGRAVKSKSQALRSARPHPFAHSAADIVGSVGGEPVTATVALPSLRGSPLDSPDLLRHPPRPASVNPPELLAWSVPAARLGPAAALAFLLRHGETSAAGDADDDPGEPADEQEFRPGSTVHALAQVALFCRDLAERGRVLPTVVRPEGADAPHRARWRAVLQGPDATFAAASVTGLPPAVRALAYGADGPAGVPAGPFVADLAGLPAGPLVADLVDRLTDAAQRARLAAAGVDLVAALPRRRGRAPARRPAAEALLAALVGPDDRIDADADDIVALRRELAGFDGFAGQPAGPAHLVLRLAEPDPKAPGQPQGEAWTLEFMLRSQADPSLLVPAARLWRDAGGLERWLDQPDRLLLAELGRAAALYPPIADALHQATPSDLRLQAADVAAFLSASAATLEQAGVEILWPAWWTHRRRLGLKGHGAPSEPGGVAEGLLSKESLYEFAWRLAVGDDELTDDEMAALTEAKAPLVQIRGDWVVFDQAQALLAIDFVHNHGSRTLTAADLVGLAIAPADRDLPLPVTDCSADGPLGALLDGTADAALRAVKPPAGLQADLRPYQRRGLSWLAFLARLGLGACLADDMGLGKTVQLLALEAMDRPAKPKKGWTRPAPTLVVCPVSLVGNWLREAERFAPWLKAVAHHGADRGRGADLDARWQGVDLVVTTYQLVVRDLPDFEGRPWSRVVLDEAQFVKNSETKAAKAVRRLEAGHRVALTGTPVENKLAELRSILDFLNPGSLGTAEEFRSRFGRPIEVHGDDEAARRLRRTTRPFILRRLKTDRAVITDLPDKIEVKQSCRLTPEQASLYQAVLGDMMDKIDATTGIERRGNVLAALAKLKQVCNHPAQFLHDGSPIGRRSGKLARLDEIVEEILAEGGKTLLFTQYTEFGDILVRHLTSRFGREVAYLHGQVPRARREEMVARFQSEGGPPLFVLSLRAGGTGLNLTAANHVIHVDRWWNPAVEDQATDRAFRIGQTKGVQVHKFCCTGTLEERIDQMIEQKKALADLVVGEGEGWLTELSTDKLRELFALDPEAVDE